MATGTYHRAIFRMGSVSILALALGACGEGLDLDLRNTFNGFDTSDAVRKATEARPRPDDRGIISYPNYQVVVARKGDSVADVAARIDMPAAELARFNGIGADVTLRKGEILALPRRVTEPSPQTGAATTGPLRPTEQIDITTLAGDAIDRAKPATPTNTRKSAERSSGREPIRHKVERGETAFSVARLYNISVKSLADWNGLDNSFTIRQGQFLLIPVALEAAPVRSAQPSAPGRGSVTPTPPSAVKALPDERATAKVETPASPNLGRLQTGASAAAMTTPVEGKIIRAFVPKKNDGIDIAAPSGSPVRAAQDGIVAAITEDVDNVPFLILRHKNNLLTVYANIDNLTVKKGDRIKRGQVVAKVRAKTPSFLHFEVRDGVDAVDPVDYLN